jgi:hypothetical protein
MMKSVIARRVLLILGGLGVATIAVVLSPPAHAQMGLEEVILAAITQVQDVMDSVTAPALQVSATISQQEQAYQQNVLYPSSSITNALGQSSNMMSSLGTTSSQFASPVNSATLPQSRALESQIDGGNTSAVGQIGGSYSSVYGPLPAASSMTPHSRMALDMSDAQAQAAMKKAVALDAIANQEQQLSQQLMKGLTSASPGSASLIAAQAAAWNLQAQAYTQGGFAQLLRLESADIAYSGQQVKKTVASQQGQSGAE